MLHTSSTHADVRSERPETTTKKTTETTTDLHSRTSLGHVPPLCRDVRPERPEKTAPDSRFERNLGKTAKYIPRPRPNPRNETHGQLLRDRLPPPDIPNSGSDTSRVASGE